MKTNCRQNTKRFGCRRYSKTDHIRLRRSVSYFVFYRIVANYSFKTIQNSNKLHLLEERERLFYICTFQTLETPVAT